MEDNNKSNKRGIKICITEMVTTEMLLCSDFVKIWGNTLVDLYYEEYKQLSNECK